MPLSEMYRQFAIFKFSALLAAFTMRIVPSRPEDTDIILSVFIVVSYYTNDKNAVAIVSALTACTPRGKYPSIADVGLPRIANHKRTAAVTFLYLSQTVSASFDRGIEPVQLRTGGWPN